MDNRDKMEYMSVNESTVCGQVKMRKTDAMKPNGCRYVGSVFQSNGHKK